MTNIQVTHGGQSVEYTRDPGTHQWMIVGEPNLPVSMEHWAGTPFLISSVRFARRLPETTGNLAAYGLDPPETIVRISHQDGNAIEVNLGIPDPDGSGLYLRAAGDDSIYVVNQLWANVVKKLASDPPYGQ